MQDHKSYHACISRIHSRMDTCYERVGGAFILVTVENFNQQILNVVSTAHFKEMCFPEIFTFFTEAVTPPGQASPLKWWTVHSPQKIYGVDPQLPVAAERERTVIREQVGFIKKTLEPLQKMHRAPFLFYYLPKIATAADPIMLCWPPEAGEKLKASQGWKTTIDIRNIQPLPSRHLISPVKPQLPASGQRTKNNSRTRKGKKSGVVPGKKVARK